jgi:SAM-dependent methyltransferase
VTSSPHVGGHDAFDLENLARARRLCDWMFDQFREDVHGQVVEVGAGIGTFTERILATGAEAVLLLEPDPALAALLERKYGNDGRVKIVEEGLPGSPTLEARAGRHDLVLCQNVLEHLKDDGDAVRAMAATLRPGGRLVLLVPAHPRLFNSVDRSYGHFRRYTRERLRRLVGAAGLELDDLHSFNLLGIAGWAVNGARGSGGLGASSLSAYELLVSAWRPVEDRLRLPWGLSLVAHARRPA